MSFNTAEIGRRIAERRHSLHMTQSELCGDFVTRNMLSRIENGEALPSLPTLIFLAEKLSVTTDYLLSDTCDGVTEKLAAALPKIREAYAAHDYKSVIYDYDKYCDGADSETAFYMADALRHAARASVFAGNLETAQKEICRAREFAEMTAIPTDAVKAELILLYAAAANVQAPKLEIDKEAYHALCRASVAEELYRYLYEDSDYPYANAKYKAHIDARILMRKGKYHEALKILSYLEDSRTDGDISALFLFRLYADMEICNREIRNYENAYRYSTKRIALLTSFRT